MSGDSFENDCDRLSHVVDAVQFERVRWAKNEGPMLEHLAQLARSTVEERPDFELTDEGSAGATKRFVLKVHSIRVVAMTVALEGMQVVVWADAIERSKYRVVDGKRHAAQFDDVDAQWMKGAIGAILREVQ